MRTNKQQPKTQEGKIFIGIDNGVSGSIGIIPWSGVNPIFHITPTISCLNYTKEKKNVTRIDHNKLYKILSRYQHAHVVMERPMVNPGRFQATASALRALEATLITLELLQIPFQYIDSKEWQKVMLPKGIKGSDELKKASLDVGKRLFPQFADKFKGDADGILIAEWARKMNL